MLKVKIKKQLDKLLLDVDFEVKDGILGLIGASGSGKSMTLKCIAGIEKPDEGVIILNDRILFDSKKNINLKPQDRRIGYLFQNYALFPDMNVWDNVFISVNNKYTLKSEREKKVRGVLSILKLDKLDKRYPSKLSGGEKQRVALARIIVNEPNFLLLDEPFSALDSYLKHKLINDLKNIIANFDKGVIFVTHDIREIKSLCKDLIILSNGNIVESGLVNDVIAAPTSDIGKELVEYG